MRYMFCVCLFVASACAGGAEVRCVEDGTAGSGETYYAKRCSEGGIPVCVPPDESLECNSAGGISWELRSSVTCNARLNPGEPTCVLPDWTPVCVEERTVCD